MNRKITSSLFLVLVTVVSCIEESGIEMESPHKADIVNYLNNLKTDQENDVFNYKIESLTKSLAYTKIVERAIRGGEILLIADFENLQDFNEEGTSKVLFFVNQGEIVRSHIITFSHENLDYDNLIVSLFNYQFNPYTYSGRISLFSVSQDIQMYKVFENGEIRESGTTHADWDRDAGGKTNGCIDWYLITTYYFTGGGKQTTEEYLFTTCDCESQNTRVARVNCAGGNGTVDGGSGGNGSPLLPSNPQSGEIYEFRDREGKLTRYRYSMQSYAWTVEYVILPELLVQSHPQTYHFLLTDSGPFHGDALIGPDSQFYTFDVFAGGWIADDCIQNQLVNPCLSNVAAKVLNPNLASTYNNLIQDVFNKDDKVNLILKEGPLTSAYGSTGNAIFSGEILNVTITLDPTKFVGSSQEFLAAAIYHECFHAVVKVLSNGNVSSDDGHVAMYTSYLNLLASSLQAAYPNMQPGDAKGLILKGLLNLDCNLNPNVTGCWESEFVNKVLSHSLFSRNQVNQVFDRYQYFHTSGTSCN